MTTQLMRPDHISSLYAPDDAERGEVTLREAVARSLNTVAVRVSEEVGRAQVVQAARRLGITALLEPHPSIALGAAEVTPLEMAAAYAVLRHHAGDC